MNYNDKLHILVNQLSGTIPKFSTWVHDNKYARCTNIQDVAMLWNTNISIRKVNHPNHISYWKPDPKANPLDILENFESVYGSLVS